MVKKASKRLNFLRKLKRANVQKADLIRFNTSCIRSVSDNAAPVFHASLPQYLIDEMEHEQKRALSIISTTLSYANAPAALDLETLVVHHHRLSQSLFYNILEDRDHRLHHLLPALHGPQYTIRFPAFSLARRTQVISSYACIYMVNKRISKETKLDKNSPSKPTAIKNRPAAELTSRYILALDLQ